MTSLDKNEPKRAGPIWGAVFTVVWVICIGALFALLLGVFHDTNQAIAEIRTTAAGLIWPFVILALGVPIIVFVWFGGYEAILRLADLRRHLDKIGQYTNDFEHMNQTASTLKGHMDGASESVAKASNSINSNFEEFENVISPKIESFIKRLKGALPTLEESASASMEVEFDNSPKPANFDDLHSLANEIFYEALDNRNASPGRGRNQLVVSRGGWDKPRIIEKLREEDRLREGTAKDLSRVFQLETSTRRWGREKIEALEIQQLYIRLQQAWREYLTPETST